MLAQRIAGEGGEIDQVCGEDAAPHYVELEYVDVGRVRGENLLEQREALACGIGNRDQANFIAAGLGPRLCAFAAQLELASECTAGDGDGFCGGGEGGAECEEKGCEATTRPMRQRACPLPSPPPLRKGGD